MLALINFLRSDDTSVAVGRMKGKEKKGEITRAMMEQRRMWEGGRTKSAKTWSGQFWTITIVFIAPETVLTFLRDAAREKHIRALSTGLFLFVEFTSSLDLLGCIFWRFSRRNSDRLAYIPISLCASLRKDFTRYGQKSISKEVSLFQMESVRHACAKNETDF